MSVKLYSDFDEGKIGYTKLIKVNDRFMIIKIWDYTSSPETAYIQFEKMKVIDDITVDPKDNKYKLVLELTEKNKDILSKIDFKAVNFIKQKSILQQIHLESGVTYRAKCVKHENGESHEVKDAIKLTFIDENSPTKIFDEDKCLITKEEIKKGDDVKVILEVSHIVFDLVDKIVTTNVVLRQVKRCRQKPIYKVLDTYSFVESDDEDGKVPENKIEPEVKKEEIKVTKIEHETDDDDFIEEDNEPIDVEVFNN
jgi:hypothetical protein